MCNRSQAIWKLRKSFISFKSYIIEFRVCVGGGGDMFKEL
jgi:hypothetical protein